MSCSPVCTSVCKVLSIDTINYDKEEFKMKCVIISTLVVFVILLNYVNGIMGSDPEVPEEET